jgi:hypothetical protein
MSVRSWVDPLEIIFYSVHPSIPYGPNRGEKQSTGCFSELARFKNSISFDKKEIFIFAKCLETMEFSAHSKKF